MLGDNIIGRVYESDYEVSYEKIKEYVRVLDDDNPYYTCLLYTSPSPRDRTRSRMPSSA